LIDRRARQAERNGEIDPTEFANRLADEWASFANSSGKSAYEGDAVGNRANTSFGTVRNVASALVDTGAVRAGEEPIRVASATPERFEETYLGKTSRASRPDQVEKAPERQEKRRGLGGRLASGVIDAAAGMVPGVGQVIGGANLVASLTGRRTLGERIVDDFMQGGSVQAANSFGASGSEDERRREARPLETASAERFEETYLIPPFEGDEIKRPTPREKFSKGRDTYARREYKPSVG